MFVCFTFVSSVINLIYSKQLFYYTSLLKHCMIYWNNKIYHRGLRWVTIPFSEQMFEATQWTNKSRVKSDETLKRKERKEKKILTFLVNFCLHYTNHFTKIKGTNLGTVTRGRCYNTFNGINCGRIVISWSFYLCQSLPITFSLIFKASVGTYH